MEKSMEDWSVRIAALAVDGLLTANIISRENFEKAVEIVEEEIRVRLSLGDVPPPDECYKSN